MSELAKRVAVAAVGVPVVLALGYLGSWWLAVPLACFAGLGALELYRFAIATGVHPFGIVGSVASALLVLAAVRFPSYEAVAPWWLATIGVVAVGALVAALFLRPPSGRPLGSVAVTVLGLVYAGLSMAVVPLLHALPTQSGWAGSAGDPWAGLIMLALPLAATWVGDAAAFFAGSAWGRSKLAPAISPNKSWVGFWAGLLGAATAAAIWHVVAGARLPGLPFGTASAAAMGAVLGLGAVVGDLAESLFKREAGVKDSGTFFPGHGGVLDRLDALVFTLPVAFVLLSVVARLS